MKKISLLIIAIGFVITVFTGLRYVTREKVVDIGDLEITANKNHTIEWSPVIGLLLMVAGGGVLVFGSKEK